jgi:hypothetical protein
VAKGKTKGGHTRVRSTQIGWLLGSQARRLDCVSSGQKTSKESLKLKGDYQARVHSDQTVVAVRREGG